MTGGTKERRRGVIDVLIDQEAHGGPSGGGDADLFGVDEGRGIFHVRLNVLHSEVRVVAFHNLLKRDPVLNGFKDTVHGNPSSLDARLAEMDLCIDDDSLARHQAPSLDSDFRPILKDSTGPVKGHGSGSFGHHVVMGVYARGEAGRDVDRRVVLFHDARHLDGLPRRQCCPVEHC